jgi:hypothetical protein
MNHPIKHTNHPDKTILASIVSIMQIGTQFLFLHKVCAHCNICGSKKVDKLAKAGNELPHQPTISNFEHHFIPY